VCDKHNLTIMLGGGSALGAVRHGGFIPWDDDLDLNMPRKDYLKFIGLFDNELSDKYQITAPNSQFDVRNIFIKIYKKNTRLVEMFNVNSDTPKGIFIDIFPIEYAPMNKVVRSLKGTLANLIYYIGTSASLYQLQNNIIKDYFFSTKTSKRNYNLRLSIGSIASVMSYKKWFNLYDRLFSQGKESDLVCIPAGRKHYFGEILPKSVFYPVKETTFNGLKAYIPNNVDTYLKNLYGDYMEIPPEEKRERHFVVEFSSTHD
jgi:lipopolysaccharide cholinephosphotransferase